MAFPRASRDEASRFSGARRLGRAEARIVRTGNTPRALRGFRLAHAWRRTCEKSRAVRHEKVPLHLVPFRGERGREVHAADPAQGHAEPARAGLVLGHGLVVLVLLGEVRLVHLGGLHDRRQARRTGEDGAREEQVVGLRGEGDRRECPSWWSLAGGCGDASKGGSELSRACRCVVARGSRASGSRTSRNGSRGFSFVEDARKRARAE